MLSDLCMKNILSQIDRLPPLIKENIIEKVNEREMERIRDQATSDVCQQMMKIVPKIRRDIRDGLGWNLSMLKSKYGDVDIQVFDAAVEIVMNEPKRRSRKE